MSKYLLDLPDEDYQALLTVKQETYLSVAVMLRLMIRNCLQHQNVWNEAVPCASGRTPLQVESK